MSAIVLFDGECNLCNAAIDFVIRNDPQGYFRFGSLQSEEAKALLASLGRDQNDFSSIVLIEDGAVSTASTAALRVAAKLRRPYNLLAELSVLPQAWRDPLYAFIAHNRYRFFGRRQTCRLPNVSDRERFI
jgi:predicted DCC family thiol-disulfide oxidoreductase YuxK